MRLISSPWLDDFQEFATRVQRSVVLAAPFITRPPLQLIADLLSGKSLDRVDILTNFSPRNLASRATDPAALAEFRDEVTVTRVIHVPGLHAKVYIADRSQAIVTSANLTTDGLRSNCEFGVWLTDSGTVAKLADHFDAYAQLGVSIGRTQLCDLGIIASNLTAVSERALRQVRQETDAALANALEEASERLREFRAASRTSINSLFAETIRIALKSGPKSTNEIHAVVKAVHPDLCDDNIDRVINGMRFGKRWKHMVRNAQQYLKRREIIGLADDKWFLR